MTDGNIRDRVVQTAKSQALGALPIARPRYSNPPVVKALKPGARSSARRNSLVGLTLAISNMLTLTSGVPPGAFDKRAADLFGQSDFAFAQALISFCIDQEAMARERGRVWSAPRATELDQLPRLWQLMRLGQRDVLPAFARCLGELLAPDNCRVSIEFTGGGPQIPFVINAIVQRLVPSLLLNALRHGVHLGGSGRIEVSVIASELGTIELSVFDDGSSVRELRPGKGHRLRVRLCGLAGGELRHWLPRSGGFGVSVLFPWPQSPLRPLWYKLPSR